MARFQDKVVIVTGGAGGIGEAVAGRLRAEGAKTVIVDLEETRAKETATRLGPDVRWIAADVASEEDTRRYVAETVSMHGRIDAAFLNAGIEGTWGKIADLPVDAFDRVMAVNVRGVWLGLSAIMPVMASGGGGSILITSSTGGLRGGAPDGRPTPPASMH